MAELSKIGPIQILSVAFMSDNFKGKIMDEINKLRGEKFIRLVDALVVHKTDEGELQAMEESDLSGTEATRYGEIIGALIGAGSGSESITREASQVMGERFHERYEFGLDKEDLEDMAEEIPEGGTAIMLMIEHLWAIPLRNALREAGGVLMAQDFLSPELLVAVGERIYAR